MKPHTALALSAFSALSLCLCLAAGCSSSTTSSPATDAGGTDSATKPDGNTLVDSGTDTSTGPTSAECMAACDTQFPAGITLNNAIDTCWGSFCGPSCVGSPSTGDAGSVDAGDAGTPACTNAVDTSDPACDTCTSTYCCGAWDGCFNSADCTGLLDCQAACP